MGNTLCYQHSLSGSAKVKPFDPKVTSKQECLITTFQEVYFVSESFEEAKEKMRYGIFFFPCYIKAGLTLPISQEQHQTLLFLPSFTTIFHGVEMLRLVFAWSSMYWVGKMMNYITIITIFKQVSSLEKWFLILTA